MGFSLIGCFHFKIGQKIEKIVSVDSFESILTCSTECQRNSFENFGLASDLSSASSNKSISSSTVTSTLTTSGTKSSTKSTTNSLNGGTIFNCFCLNLNTTQSQFSKVLNVDCNSVFNSTSNSFTSLNTTNGVNTTNGASPFPAGSVSNSSLFSVYLLSNSSMDLPDPAAIIGGTGIVNLNPSTVFTKSTSNSNDRSVAQRNLAFFIGLGLVGFLLISVFIWWILKRYHIRKLPSVPRLTLKKSKKDVAPGDGLLGKRGSINRDSINRDSINRDSINRDSINMDSSNRSSRVDSFSTTSSYTTSSTDSFYSAMKTSYLIPGLLVKIPSRIYITFTPYQAIRSDEVSLSKNDVVQVVKVIQKYEWALVNNVSTGSSGIAPLICLVDFQAVGKGKKGNHVVEIPLRVK